MLSDINNLDEWAHNLDKDIGGLSAQASDNFSLENLRAYLVEIYQVQCKKSINALIDAYRYLVSTRASFLTIQVTFYQHITLVTFLEYRVKRIPKTFLGSP